MSNRVENLASYQRCVQSIRANWPPFLEKRKARLEQQQRHGVAAEKVAENILEDLFTEVLDWTVADLNNQVEHADLLLSRLGIKYLLIEVKRPGALAWNRRAVESALDQALRYAGEQKVKCVAVSDGGMLYTADIEHGGLRDRAFVSLQSEEPQEKMLWRISLHGIYRPCECSEGAALDLIPKAGIEADLPASAPEEQLLHPKYKVPARCFAYVGDPGNTATWKLPYRLANGSPDVKRLPKAIQAILSNYRGVKVSSVPEKDIPDVLVRLARAAASQGRMPQQAADTAPVYIQLAEALAQLGRLEEVIEKGSWVRP
jgi:hypothetical protein